MHSTLSCDIVPADNHDSTRVNASDVNRAIRFVNGIQAVQGLKNRCLTCFILSKQAGDVPNLD